MKRKISSGGEQGQAANSHPCKHPRRMPGVCARRRQ
eukprot:CAMPEP_0117576300 /NCGR_PEP_ID=MMETSP0784-20121206/62718_1 /TAXON_ID=39447 /ORGANISM="" /LENGTH=35 /DNA_ID= /DNA_START= /DNA_END= /DNA_ORIENTATION=